MCFNPFPPSDPSLYLDPDRFWQLLRAQKPPFAISKTGHNELTAYLHPQSDRFLHTHTRDQDLQYLFTPNPASPAQDSAAWVGFFGYEFLAAASGLPTHAHQDLSVPEGWFFRPGTVLRTRYEPTPQGAIAHARPAADFACNQSFDAYQRMFAQAQEAIRSGNTYQIKLSIRFECPWNQCALDAFRYLLSVNPAPEAFLLVHPEFTLISCSPETVLHKKGSTLITRPIGGTLPRHPEDRPEAIVQQFASNPKETAEHNMLVDLERNDLSKVCQPGTVKVSKFRYLESYQHVHHLVSEITGELQPGVHSEEIVKALLPGGSVTGCPKYRTMQLIDQFEPCFRGPYTGSFGTIASNGDCHFNIIIRTVLVLGNRAYAQAGGGIVIDSSPEYEYRENCLKARSLLDMFTRL